MSKQLPVILHKGFVPKSEHQAKVTRTQNMSEIPYLQPSPHTVSLKMVRGRWEQKPVEGATPQVDSQACI